MPRWLARLTGRDLRDQLAEVARQQQFDAGQQQFIGIAMTTVGRQLVAVLENQQREMELMSQLDTSTDNLTAAVNDALQALGTGPADLAAALTQIADLNTQIAALQANDQADADQIAALTSQRDELVADSQENAEKLQQTTDRIREVVPAATPADPAPEPEPAPADPVFPVDPEV